MIILRTHKRALTDGSAVFSVTITDQDNLAISINLPCVTSADAFTLAGKIGAAITAHTNEDAIYRD